MSGHSVRRHLSSRSRGDYAAPEDENEDVSTNISLDNLSQREPTLAPSSISEYSERTEFLTRSNDTEPGVHGRPSEEDAPSHPRPSADYTPQEKAPATATNKWTHHAVSWWMEVLCCFLALGLLAALVSVLWQFDGEPAPEWPLGIPLSGLVAVLTTLCRALTFIPVAEGLSQLKWNWFAGPKRRSVMDLYAFDQATRGPWGAFLLMFRMRGRFIGLGTVASAVIFSGLATSFLTQIAVTQELQLVAIASNDPDFDATRPSTTKRSEWTALDFPRFRDAGLQAVFTDPLSNKKTTHVVRADCPTGNCEWDKYTSLSVCASVANVTEHMTVEEISIKEIERVEDDDKEDAEDFTAWRASLLEGRVYSDDYTRNSLGKNMLEDWEMIANSTLNTTDLPGYARSGLRPTLGEWDFDDRLAISQLFLIWRLPQAFDGDISKSRVYEATEIMWHWCANSYNTTVINGTTVEEVEMLNATIDEIEYYDMTFSTGNDGQEFRVEPDDPFDHENTHEYLKDFFGGAFSGSYVLFNRSAGEGKGYMPHWDGKVNGYAWMGSPAAPDFWRVFGNQAFGVKDTGSPINTTEEVAENLKGLAENIAGGLTTFMRSTATADEDQVRGTALTTKNVVTIRWEWLSLLIAQIAFTIVFLVAVIVYTARLDIEIVKSSNIAELLALNRHPGGTACSGTEEGEKLLVAGIRAEMDRAIDGTLVKNDKRWILESG